MKKLALLVVAVCVVIGMTSLTAVAQSKDLIFTDSLLPMLPNVQTGSETIMIKISGEIVSKHMETFQKLGIVGALDAAAEVVREGYLEQGIEVLPQVLDGGVAAYFKVPTAVITTAKDILLCDEIPMVRLLLTTRDLVTEENLSALAGNGYKVQGSFGRFVQVEVSLASLISSVTGLQTLDFVLSSSVPPEAI
ncbi:MAG: hypothetical protein P9X27_01420 [Candidatus Kaelpia aquatica]|nr:hypothetical protein [Candidatus Kaelpia aquatica]